MSLTPHGPGFAFLDSFEVLVAGRQGRGSKYLDPELPFFADHFPGEPLMPGVLLIECAAQAAGALWASILNADVRTRFALAQVGAFKFKAPVQPGDTIESDLTFDRQLGELAQFNVVLRVGELEVARGQLILSKSPT